MRTFVLLVALASVGLSANAACPQNSAETLVSGFYGVGQHPSVPPSRPELESSRHLLSARLYSAFEAATDYQTRWIAMHPSEPSPSGGPPIVHKPPFVDGDIFTGSPDGASTFVISGAVRDAAGAWRVRVESRPQPRMSSWSVAVVVVHESGACAIDDVLYEGATSPGTLLEYLSYRDK